MVGAGDSSRVVGAGQEDRRPQCPDLLRPAGVRNRFRRGPRPYHGDRRDALARPPQTVLVRFRHPERKPIKSVTVNGEAWSDFDPAKEVVRLHDVQGSVKVEAAY